MVATAAGEQMQLTAPKKKERRGMSRKQAIKIIIGLYQIEKSQPCRMDFVQYAAISTAYEQHWSQEPTQQAQNLYKVTEQPEQDC